MEKLIFILIFLVACYGCALDRSNPLDPVEHDIDVPNEVLGINISHSSSDKIDITWIAQDDADGYYIYRCMSIDGEYVRIDNDKINFGSEDNFTDNEVFPGQWYYYKMSAYRWVGDKRLEGRRSKPKTW